MTDLIFDKKTKYGDIWKMDREFWWDDDGNHSIPQTPEGLRFTVDNEVKRENDYLILKGWLENKTNQTLEVPIFPSPEIFYLKFVNTDRITFKPDKDPNPPYQVPPPPHVLFIHKNERIEFLATLNLRSYNYPPSLEAELEWTFSYWHKPRPQGRLKFFLEK